MNSDLAAIARALDRLEAGLHKGAWDYINTVAIVLTLLVLIWYTIETYKLRRAAQRQTKKTGKLLKEAQRQNEMSVMPMLAVFRQPNDRDQIFILKNVGTGSAFNVSIDRHQWPSGELFSEHDSNVMTPGESTDLRLLFQEQSGGIVILDADTLYEWMNTGRIANPLNIVLRCSSVNFLVYAFTFRFTLDAGRLKITFEGMRAIV